MALPLIEIEDLSYAVANHSVISNLNLTINEKQHWAICGSGASGKTTLLKIIGGIIEVQNGMVKHRLSNNLIKYVDVKHDFKNLSNNKGFFYQQRYSEQFAKESQKVHAYLDDITLKQQLPAFWTKEKITALFKLQTLLDKYLIQLSNGESKRLRIAAALLHNPKILLLDDPLTGLDVEQRKYFDKVFETIVNSGINLIISSPNNEIPIVIRKVIHLTEGSTYQIFNTADYKQKQQGFKQNEQRIKSQLLSFMLQKPKQTFETIVKMKHVKVSYEKNTVLENIHWTIKRAEKWALSGPNGSGKSTLLSLIYADHPQAYGNDIELFGKPRGKGESIWDIKSRIGYMSPELFQCFPVNYTCLQVIVSGFYDSIGIFQKISLKEKKEALQWMQSMEIHHLAYRKLNQVSTSQQRICLLTRALVKSPHLLILDEPCQGFDSAQQLHFRNLIDQISELSEMAIIYVTHHEEQLPKCIEKKMVLK